MTQTLIYEDYVYQTYPAVDIKPLKAKYPEHKLTVEIGHCDVTQGYQGWSYVKVYAEMFEEAAR